MAAFCTNCGVATGPSDRFCAECGHSVAATEPDRPGTTRAASTSSAARWGIPTLILVAVIAVGGTYAFVASDADDVLPSPSTTLPAAADVTTTTEQMATTTTMAAPASYTEAQLAERFGDAVYRVETSGCGYKSIGSAWVIGPNHLVTNAHVVENDPEPTLVSRKGQRLQGRVIGYSDIPDVAVIEVRNELSPVLEWAATSALSEGDRLVSIGYPVPESVFTVTPGNIISFRAVDGVREAVRTDANLDFGNSGGPALTVEGRVAGVVTRMDRKDGFQFVALVYTSAVLRDFVEDAIARPAEIRARCDGQFITPSDPADSYPDPFDPFWTVILMSVDYLTQDFTVAFDRMYEMWGYDIPADILLSDDFPSLNPGYWVVYAGRFGNSDEARRYCQDITPLVVSCYPRLVSWDSSQR